MRRSGLGRGIQALIPGPEGRAGGLAELPCAEIRPNPLQPRRQFGAEGLAELAASLQRHGVLQPVVVARAPEGGYYLIAGERRWRAARQAGLERIPAVVRDEVGDADRLALALIENLQREDLTPIEEARAYHHLRTELGLSQETIAAQVGKERSTVANAMRLLQLPLALQARVDSGELSAGHGRALVGVNDARQQEAFAERCVAEGWSVRDLERRLRPPSPSRRRRAAPNPETEAASEQLGRALGARVEIRRRRRGGEIRIAFSDEEDLIRLFKRLSRERS